MRVLIASEAHFVKAADGCVYAGGPEDYSFWASYLDVFDRVGVLARLRPVATPRPSQSRADGDKVVFSPLDYYRGPWGYLSRLARLRRQVEQSMAGHDVFLLRAPGAVAYLAWREVRRRGKPYAVEVLGDPWESLGPASGTTHVLRPLVRRWSRSRLRQICREAPVTCYVTSSWLQQHYRPGPGKTFACSDVRLGTPATEQQMTARHDRIRQAAAGRQPWQVGFIGSLERFYKAPDVHLAAVAICRRHGFDVRFSVVGAGRCRPHLERLARRLGILEAVRFLGTLGPGRPVEAFLDGIDLFVLASRAEGLPRALIEAMTRGCPAIGSTAGGIPELLAPDDLVQPGRADLLAGRLMEAFRSPARLWAMARANWVRARRFSPELLRPLRREFLWELRNLCT